MKGWSISLLVTLLAVVIIPVSANPFSDIPSNHWAYGAVKTLTEKGFMMGMPDGTFKGEQKVNRYQLAVTLARVLENISSIKDKGDSTDFEAMEKLTAEFADELALLGVNVSALEKEFQLVRNDIIALGYANPDCGSGSCKDGITVTGDARI